MAKKKKIQKKDEYTEIDKAIDPSLTNEYKSKTQEQRLYEVSIGHNVGPQGTSEWNEYQSLNEPYQFKEENVELMKDISSSTPLDTPKYAVKGFWGVPSETQQEVVKMEIHYKYESIDDGLENVLPEYAELIKQMRMAKHRNEIICAEIDNKHNMFMESLKNHH